MAEQTLGDRDERLAANFDGTEFTECFPTSQGVSFRSKLGTAASRDVTTSSDDKTADRLLKVGDGGLLGTGSIPSTSDFNDTFTSFVKGDASNPNSPPDSSGALQGIQVFGLPTTGMLTILTDTSQVNPQIFARARTNGSWVRLYHTANTTVDSNGFIKEASPIIRLFATGEIEEPSQPTGAKVTRKSKGHYEITGTLGFAHKGWYIETPKDANGSIKVLTEYSQTKAGKITVKTYEPTGQGWRPEKGDPIDIPDGRWIDIRLEAPEPEPEETDAQ